LLALRPPDDGFGDIWLKHGQLVHIKIDT